MPIRSLLTLTATVVPTFVLLAGEPETPAPKGVVKVAPGKPTLDGAKLLPEALAKARAALATARDYAGHVVIQEQVNGVAAPEQVIEIRARTTPASVNLRTVKPDALRGQELSYQPEVARQTVRFKPAGVEGVRGFQTVPVDSPKVLTTTRHPATEVGLAALVNRVERIVATEQSLGHPVAVTASAYQFGKQAVTRFEVFADIAHANRYAAKSVVFFDTETHLPVRFEAYDAKGTLLEVQSYVNLKTNLGLGNPAFDR